MPIPTKDRSIGEIHTDTDVGAMPERRTAMNVSGVTAPPVVPPVPAVTKPPASSGTSGTPLKRSPEEVAAAAAKAAAAERAAEKLPPLKPLSTTEMRVILGAIPPSQAIERARNGSAKGGSFDAYA
jgi:nucleotide-binding universal stress UspA family protein